MRMKHPLVCSSSRLGALAFWHACAVGWEGFVRKRWSRRNEFYQKGNHFCFNEQCRMITVIALMLQVLRNLSNPCELILLQS